MIFVEHPDITLAFFIGLWCTACENFWVGLPLLAYGVWALYQERTRPQLPTRRRR